MRHTQKQNNNTRSPSKHIDAEQTTTKPITNNKTKHAIPTHGTTLNKMSKKQEQQNKINTQEQTRTTHTT